MIILHFIDTNTQEIVTFNCKDEETSIIMIEDIEEHSDLLFQGITSDEEI